MSNITLIMTRTPLEEVDFGKKNGRWGKMLVVKGGKVISAAFSGQVEMPDHAFLPFGMRAAIDAYNSTAGMATNLGFGPATEVTGRTTVRLGHRNVVLNTMGGDVEVVESFDTLERYRGEIDRSTFFVQLKPRPIAPYEIRMAISERVKKVNKSGQCFRVMGHDTKSQNGGTAGILIHEAPHPGWLIGCIAPRELNNKVANNNHGPTRRAIEKIFRHMGGFSLGRKASLLVMD